MSMHEVVDLEKKHYKTITLHIDDYETLAEIKKFLSGKVSLTRIISLTWPRCPLCGGILVREYDKRRVFCLKCGTTFILEKVEMKK
ncbi:MAG: hypothetical protein ACP5IE_04295 [Infirmifilum sp.]